MVLPSVGSRTAHAIPELHHRFLNLAPLCRAPSDPGRKRKASPLRGRTRDPMRPASYAGHRQETGDAGRTLMTGVWDLSSPPRPW